MHGARKRQSLRTEANMSGGRVARVKNKAPAARQITAEQILREAFEGWRQEEAYRAPASEIVDEEELRDYRLGKRKHFEDRLRLSRQAEHHWLKYAKWEEGQHAMENCRSVFERALDELPRSTMIWLKYAEMEMRNKNVNHARNVLDRAVTLLPRVDQLWFKYVFMEDILGHYAGVRQVFERWMQWSPQEPAWNAYINFELRHGEVERARQIYKKLVQAHPIVRTWCKWAAFEHKQGEIENARQVYEGALEFLGEEAHTEYFFIRFAAFEERVKEVERARTIYRYALDHISKAKAEVLYQKWVTFEKQNGSSTEIEDVIISKRRFEYEEELRQNAYNYDVWFDYLRLEEQYSGDGDVDVTPIRELYERAVAAVPLISEKQHWKRYVYLWINYAIFEELSAKDVTRARSVYEAVHKLIPHSSFSFSKLWILWAHFEIRQLELTRARHVFGQAIGHTEKAAIFTAYIDMESKLGNIDRTRTLYAKWLELQPFSCTAWCQFAELEVSLAEYERARALYELAIGQESLDTPEKVWKDYIDFEISNEEDEKVRLLYERLLERTKHPKVWDSFGRFEASLGDVESARAVYRRAFEEFRVHDNKEERALLLDLWIEWEEEIGEEGRPDLVREQLPERIKRRRPVVLENGEDGGWEEYYDYVFPDEQGPKPNLTLLQRALAWKQQQQQQPKQEQEEAPVAMKDDDEEGDNEGEAEEEEEEG